jgi:hypothetical protein
VQLASWQHWQWRPPLGAKQHLTCEGKRDLSSRRAARVSFGSTSGASSAPTSLSSPAAGLGVSAGSRSASNCCVIGCKRRLFNGGAGSASTALDMGAGC